MKRILTILMAAAILAAGCTEQIDLKSDGLDKTFLAVEAFLTDQSSQEQVIRLSRSVNYFSEEEAPAVSGASVTVSWTGGSVTFREKADEKGTYSAPVGWCATPGYTYKLSIEAEVGGRLQSYEATADMLEPKFEVTSIDYAYTPMGEALDSIWTVSIWGKDSPGTDYYMLGAAVNGHYLPKDISLSMDDKYFQGQTVAGFPVCVLAQNAESRALYGEAAKYLETGDMLTLTVYTLTKDFYDFKMAVSSNAFVSIPLFSSQPANCPTNITGGDAVGYFALASSSSASRFVDDPMRTEHKEDISVAAEGETILTYDELVSNAGIGDYLSMLGRMGAMYGIGDISALREDGRCYLTTAMKFRSIDPAGKELWLSGRVYLSCTEDGTLIPPEHVVIASHSTIASDAECPSKAYTVDGVLALRRGLVICPDQIGYGQTAALPHPYCMSEITGRGAVDMFRAVRNWMEAKGMPLDASLPVYSVGYSQGGASALAVQKYIEDNGLKGDVNLAGTYCGDGPYSLELMMKRFIEDDWCTLPGVLPMTLAAAKYCWPQIMTEDYGAYLSDALVEAGIMDLILGKQTDISTIGSEIAKAVGSGSAGGVRTSLILSEGMMTPGSKVHDQMMQVAALNELASGWSPATPVHFLHHVNDELVFYDNFELARRNIANDMTTFESVDYPLFNSHAMNALLFYGRALSGAYLQ